MKITKNTLKQLIREEINEIGLPEPELDPESPFARFYEIMDGHGEGWGLIDRVERCMQDPIGAGKCSDIANAASDALYELRRNMSSENHDRFRPLWAALAYLSDIPQNPEVHAGWKLNPRTIEDLKSGFEIFKQEKPHRSIALEEKKITKKQLTQIIREELETVLTEDAIERMKGRTQKVSVWKTFCKNSTTANYPKGEDGKPRNPNEMPDELTKCSAVARIVYNELNK